MSECEVCRGAGRDCMPDHPYSPVNDCEHDYLVRVFRNGTWIYKCMAPDCRYTTRVHPTRGAMTSKATPRPWRAKARGSGFEIISEATKQVVAKIPGDVYIDHGETGWSAHQRAEADTYLIGTTVNTHERLQRMAEAGEELVKATKALQANASALADELSENNTDTRSLWLEDDEVVLAASVQAIAAYEEASREGPR